MTYKEQITEYVLDILVQLAFVVFVCIDRENIFWVIFAGGLWQLMSFFYHNRQLSEISKRKYLYWQFAKGVLITLLVCFFIYVIALAIEAIDGLMFLVLLGMFLSFIVGVILYAFYFFLCILDIKELYREIKKNDK
jgi:fatty acid desaturase